MNEVYMLWIPEKGNYYGKPVIHWFLAEDKGITFLLIIVVAILKAKE
jgi:hypothetical protein